MTLRQPRGTTAPLGSGAWPASPGLIVAAPWRLCLGINMTVHRADMGRHYRGLPMHAAAGVHEYALALAKHHLEPGVTVLDAGCGIGALAQRLHDAKFVVTATDVDTSDYRGEPPSFEWDITDPKGAPSDTYAAVFAVEVLEHLENPLAALRNLRALLQPGGTLIVSTPHLGHPRSRIKYLLRGAPAYFGRVEYHQTGHRTMLPDWLLVRHLETVGFTSIDVSYGGRLELTGPGRYPYAVLRSILSLLRRMPAPRVGDGAATFVVAR